MGGTGTGASSPITKGPGVGQLIVVLIAGIFSTKGKGGVRQAIAGASQYGNRHVIHRRRTIYCSRCTGSTG